MYGIAVYPQIASAESGLRELGLRNLPRSTVFVSGTAVRSGPPDFNRT